MKNYTILTAVIISLFLLSVFGDLQTNFLVKGNFCFGPSNPAISIESPTNSTYNTTTLSLNMSVYTYKTGYVGGPTHNSSRLFVYSLDGKPYEPITLTRIDVGRNPGNDVFFEGSEILSDLAPGPHNLTVRVVFDYPPPDYEEPTYGEFHTESNSTVVFWIDTVPNISLLMSENNTYTSNEIPLQFVLNGSTSGISYCLDGQENVTVSGNTTLTGLSSGAHAVTLYAWNRAGNIGSSETMIFNVKAPEEEITTTENLEPTTTENEKGTTSKTKAFPTELLFITSALSLVVIGVSLVIHFKKHKH